MFSRLRRAVSSESAGALNSDIQRVAGSSQHTREAASEMQQVTAAQQFLVQTYARDTGAIVTLLTAPIFVKGRRWGAVLLGWNSDGAR